VNDEDEVRCHLDGRDFEKAFDLVVGLYKDKVFGLAYSMVGGVSQAEDVTQDVFLRVWRALPLFEARSSLSTWIYAITRNACINLKASGHERAMARRDRSERDLASPYRNPDAKLLVEELLQHLPPEYRMVLTLYYLEESSCEEVGRRLEMPAGTVKTYLHRARRLLAEVMRQRARPGGAE
jgi:RNA polymerase sigma-70 factor (ECF subfamily)